MEIGERSVEVCWTAQKGKPLTQPTGRNHNHLSLPLLFGGRVDLEVCRRLLRSNWKTSREFVQHRWLNPQKDNNAFVSIYSFGQHLYKPKTLWHVFKAGPTYIYDTPRDSWQVKTGYCM